MAAFSFIEGLSFAQLDELVPLHVVLDEVDTSTDVDAKVNPVVDLPYWTRGSVGFTIAEPFEFFEIEDSQWRNWYFIWKGFTYFWNQVVLLPGRQLLFVHAISPSFSTISTDLSGLPAYVNDDEAVAAGLEIGMPYWVLAGSESVPEGTLVRVGNETGYPAPFTTVPFGLGLLNAYASDADAIAAGLATADPYWAAEGHENYPIDSLVRVS